jgi:cytochrome subunit of sulfide dehydrogenase
MRTQLVAAVVFCACAMHAVAQDDAAKLGRNLAATCANCHNTAGKSVTGTPSIAGLPRDVMLNTLKEFRDGKRPATVMHQLTKGYSDTQLELVAAHFAAQK